MIDSLEFSEFLKSVQVRAFKTARYALKDDDLALDAVQESMIKLAQKYADAAPAEWPLLFQRILQNTVYDQLRHQKVKNTWVTLFSNLFPGQDEDDSDFDPLEGLLADSDQQSQDGQTILERQQLLSAIEDALENLPARQREAFLLRYWEEMDVAETAKIMGCSEGSVKTHCSRAVASLAKILKSSQNK